MKERPILFSGPMVRAILEGRKTQTRRIVKPQPYESEYNPGSFGVWYKQPKTETHNVKQKNRETGEFESTTSTIKKGSLLHAQVTIDWWKDKCPYGQPGDRLWVKEKHRVGAWQEDGRIAFDYAASPELVNTPWRQSPEEFDFESAWVGWSDYLSDHNVQPDDDGQYHWEPGKSPLPWRPSIFMHRWASRITLEVVSVRVERLNSITDDDARAEGVAEYAKTLPPGSTDWMSRVDVYQHLWESINGAGSWDANPWVWVIEFKRIQS